MENPVAELPKQFSIYWNTLCELPKRLIGKVIYWFNALLCYPAPPRGGYIRGAIGRYFSYDLLMGFHPYIITMVLPNPMLFF